MSLTHFAPINDKTSGMVENKKELEENQKQEWVKKVLTNVDKVKVF